MAFPDRRSLDIKIKQGARSRDMAWWQGHVMVYYNCARDCIAYLTDSFHGWTDMKLYRMDNGGRMWRGDRLQNWAHLLMLELSSCIHSFPGGFYFFLLPNCWLCLILGKLPPTCTTGGSRRHVEESSVKTAGEKVSLDWAQSGFAESVLTCCSPSMMSNTEMYPRQKGTTGDCRAKETNNIFFADLGVSQSFMKPLVSLTAASCFAWPVVVIRIISCSAGGSSWSCTAEHWNGEAQHLSRWEPSAVSRIHAGDEPSYLRNSSVSLGFWSFKRWWLNPWSWWLLWWLYLVVVRGKW